MWPKASTNKEIILLINLSVNYQKPVKTYKVLMVKHIRAEPKSIEFSKAMSVAATVI